jgi:nucleoside-diphosphate-sugar epimerase
MPILKEIKMASHSNILITGGKGFTGYHLSKLLNSRGYQCHDLSCNILDKNKVQKLVHKIQPVYVFHLAAISFTEEKDTKLIYETNIIGTMNLLEAIDLLEVKPKKVILSSSASVYGENGREYNSEEDTAVPVNHYGCSKLSMENLARNYFNSFPIIITRPFNYTGVGHNRNFIIPKILNAYLSNDNSIELGNLDVSREFNDVRDIVEMYFLLMKSCLCSEIINLCSGNSYSLKEIISLMKSITGKDMDVDFNPAFARPNDISILSGSPYKLKNSIDFENRYNIKDTLKWMYEKI